MASQLVAMSPWRIPAWKARIAIEADIPNGIAMTATGSGAAGLRALYDGCNDDREQQRPRINQGVYGCRTAAFHVRNFVKHAERTETKQPGDHKCVPRIHAL